MFYYAIILYNKKIINFYFKCEGDLSASLLAFYILEALPNDGRNYRPKHVVVNVMNKWIYNLVNKANLVHNLFLVYLSICTCFGRLWAHHSSPKYVEIDKYTRNKLCTKLALFTRLYRDARSTKHRIHNHLQCCINRKINKLTLRYLRFIPHTGS